MDQEALEFKKNRASVIERITEAARRSGRSLEDIRLMAVTKTRSITEIRIARQNGIELFGENRVQEALEKFGMLEERPELHLIGHLQRNKAKVAAGIFNCVESIDKVETALQLDKWCSAAGKKIDILLEVNTSGEETKFGVREEDQLFMLIDSVTGLDSLCLRGLMTVGPLTSDRNRIRSAFTGLREFFERTKDRFPELPINTLSMGMSGDYDIAVEEGATLIRIGTALFGPRR